MHGKTVPSRWGHFRSVGRGGCISKALQSKASGSGMAAPEDVQAEAGTSFQRELFSKQGLTGYGRSSM